MRMSVKHWAAVGVIGAMLAAMPVYGPAVLEAGQQGIAQAAATPAAPSQAAAERTISVSGIGKLTIQPDVAYANFGVMTRANTAEEAQSANAKTFAAIEKTLKEQFGVDAKDIKTSGFSVQPEYDYSEKGQAKVVGYTANHTVTVTYRDLDGLGELLDGVSKAGANRVNSIQFGTEKSEAYELQAIELAMKNARVKADTIAKAAGRSVKGVLHVEQYSQGGGGYPPIVYAKMDAMGAAESAYSTSIQPGELEFTTTVNITYEM